MTYYWFNRQEFLQKAKKKHNNGDKENAAKYYQANKDVMEEKANSKCNNVPKEERETKKSIARICMKNERKCKKNTNLFLQYKDE